MMSGRAMRSWGYLAIAISGVGVIWVGPALLLSHPGAFGLATATRLLLRVLAATVAMAWAIIFAALAYRAQDEFTRDASKFAWYWGGALGVGVSAPIYVFIALGGLHLIGAGPPAAERHAAFLGFASGYGLMAASLAVGFVIARLWWTVSKR
jgi:hypothetical protein